jgi:hypothetical protein
MSMPAHDGVRITQDDDGTVVVHVRPGARFKVVEDEPTTAPRRSAMGVLAGKISYVPTMEDFEELSRENIAANEAKHNQFNEPR